MDEPEGFRVPIRQSLSEPMLIAGVPRLYMIVNFLLGWIMIVNLRLWHWFWVPIVIHLVGAYIVTKTDPDIFKILRRYFKSPDHLEP
jgi:type IV secretion system protein VirB3